MRRRRWLLAVVMLLIPAVALADTIVTFGVLYTNPWQQTNTVTAGINGSPEPISPGVYCAEPYTITIKTWWNGTTSSQSRLVRVDIKNHEPNPIRLKTIYVDNLTVFSGTSEIAAGATKIMSTSKLATFDGNHQFVFETKFQGQSNVGWPGSQQCFFGLKRIFTHQG
jgi:hypothetical protein